MRHWGILIIVSFAFFLLAPTLHADEILAVLSSDLKAYEEAFQGFQTKLGRKLKKVVLNKAPPRIQSNTKVVVAFGGKASVFPYPEHVSLITCLAPGVALDPQRRTGRTISVGLMAHPDLIIDAIRKIDPAIKSIASFYMSDAFDAYHGLGEKASLSNGIRTITRKLSDMSQLPNALRSLPEKPDAILLLPDPLVISHQTMSIFKEYSRGNRVPLFVTTEGLMEETGAVASIAVSYRAIGALTGELTLDILSQKDVPRHICPSEIEIKRNPKYRQPRANPTPVDIPPQSKEQAP